MGSCCTRVPVSGAFIIALNVLINILLIIALSVPWYQWKLGISDTNSPFECNVVHSIGWFQEYCTVSFWCNGFNDPDYCAGVQFNWQAVASGSSRKSVYNASFACCIIALCINLVGFGIAIYRHVKKNKSYHRVKSIFATLQFPFLLAALCHFPSALPGSYSDDSGGSGAPCTVPYAPNFYENTTTTGTNGMVTPCNSIAGTINFDNGQYFEWHGSGFYALIPAVILSFIMCVLYLSLAFLKNENHGKSDRKPIITTVHATTTVPVVMAYNAQPYNQYQPQPPIIQQYVHQQPQPQPYQQPPQFQQPYPQQPYPQQQQPYPQQQSPYPQQQQQQQVYQQQQHQQHQVVVMNSTPVKGNNRLDSVLREIGMEKYIENFRKHDFDYETFLKFPFLKAHEQENIVPEIGARLRIQSYIEEVTGANKHGQNPIPPNMIYSVNPSAPTITNEKPPGYYE